MVVNIMKNSSGVSKRYLFPVIRQLRTPKKAIPEVDWLLNITNARRAYAATKLFFEMYPGARGGHIFAEDIPEIEALKIYDEYVRQGKVIAGPAGVGLIVAGALKLGVVGGVDWRQIKKSRLEQAGSVAVLSASGGMINELINLVANTGHLFSFLRFVLVEIGFH